MGQKAANPFSDGGRMSRLYVILLVLLLLIVGAAIYLSTINSEQPTSRVEQDVTNEALAH